LASAYHSKDDIEKAQFYFRKAIELSPKYADAYFNLGICYQDKGSEKDLTEDKSREQYELALEKYQKALELDPEMLEAAEAIEALEKQLKSHDPWVNFWWLTSGRHSKHNDACSMQR